MFYRKSTKRKLKECLFTRRRYTIKCSVNMSHADLLLTDLLLTCCWHSLEKNSRFSEKCFCHSKLGEIYKSVEGNILHLAVKMGGWTGNILELATRVGEWTGNIQNLAGERGGWKLYISPSVEVKLNEGGVDVQWSMKNKCDTVLWEACMRGMRIMYCERHERHEKKWSCAALSKEQQVFIDRRTYFDLINGYSCGLCNKGKVYR